MKYDVFLSYRRDGGFETAKHIYDLLTRDGYSVSFDIDTLKSGDFDKQLLLRIEECQDFILIVDKNAFKRTLDGSCKPEQDWLRCELAHALTCKKNVIPVFLAGVSGFPESLPSDIADVVNKNGPQYNRMYFDAFYERLKVDFLLSKSSKAKSKKNIIAFLAVLLLLCVIFMVSNRYVTNRNHIHELNNSIVKADSILHDVYNALDLSSANLNIDNNKVQNVIIIYDEYIAYFDEDNTIRTQIIEKRSILSTITDSLEAYNKLTESHANYLRNERYASAQRTKKELDNIAKNIQALFESLCSVK